MNKKHIKFKVLKFQIIEVIYIYKFKLDVTPFVKKNKLLSKDCPIWGVSNNISSF